MDRWQRKANEQLFSGPSFWFIGICCSRFTCCFTDWLGFAADIFGSVVVCSAAVFSTLASASLVVLLLFSYVYMQDCIWSHLLVNTCQVERKLCCFILL